MSHAKSIAQNAAWLMIATTAQKAISFVTFTLIARLVDVAVTGEYFFAVSITSIFVTIADLGLTPVLIREMAADEKRGRAAFARAMVAKAILLPLTAGLAIGYAWLIGARGDTFTAVVISALFVMAADATSVLWYGAIRGRRELRYEAAGMFMGQILTAVVSISAAYLGYGVIGLVCGLAVASVWNVAWSLYQVWKLGLWPTGATEWSWRELASMALPFAMAGIFVKIYSYVDTQILKVVHGSIAVGQYAVAYKLTYALQFVPMAFVAALYPGLSHAAQHDKGAIPGILRGSQRLMLIASVPMAALLSALSGRLIDLLYGARYAGSIPTLLVLPWVLIPIFLDFPIGSLLNSTRRAHLKTAAMGIAMVMNVILNFILVPPYGPVGAAWSGVVSFWALFFIGWWFVRDEMALAWFGPLFLRGLGAALVTWAAVMYFAPPMTNVFAFVFAVAAGLAALFLFGLLTTRDVMIAFGWLKRRVQPIPQEDADLHDKP
ncbi:flippase [Patescibacteria group bacterium]|jgi:O-antigen/teichoic acid export membrane protein|nr:flippase [Patescibacteria group bacterium]